jgi:hypothetical protein
MDQLGVALLAHVSAGATLLDACRHQLSVIWLDCIKGVWHLDGCL